MANWTQALADNSLDREPHHGYLGVVGRLNPDIIERQSAASLGIRHSAMEIFSIIRSMERFSL